MQGPAQRAGSGARQLGFAGARFTAHHLATALDAKGKEDLKQAQRAWIKFRDLQITAIGSVYSESGTMGGISGGAQVMQITKEQALRLSSMVNR